MSIRQVRELFDNTAPMAQKGKSVVEPGADASDKLGIDSAVGAHDPCTHLANAHRLAEHFHDQLLFVEGIRGDHLGSATSWELGVKPSSSVESSPKKVRIWRSGPQTLPM